MKKWYIYYKINKQYYCNNIVIMNYKNVLIYFFKNILLDKMLIYMQKQRV